MILIELFLEFHFQPVFISLTLGQEVSPHNSLFRAALLLNLRKNRRMKLWKYGTAKP